MRAQSICVLLLAALATLTTSTAPKQPEVSNKTLALVTLQLSNNASDTLETAPSAITSVHQQVWTSSSSGSLDELSPEMISKLRNDVPFLAAYALRPRLVGGGLGGPSVAPTVTQQQVVEHVVRATPTTAASSKLDTSSSEGVARVVRQGSSNSGKLQSAAGAKLGDFSEFNVETSSLSKSEHHHRRKTSLKRAAQPNVKSKSDKDDEFAGRLKSGGTKRRPSKAKRRTARRRSAGRLQAATRRRTSSQKQIANNDDDVKRTTNGTEVDDNSGVKGGATGTKRPAFYASKRPVSEETPADTPTDRESSLAGGRDKGRAGDEPTNELADELDDEPELDEAPPKRVGDDDVEPEVGDTVLVEPKSDGVDDDPPLPADDEVGVDRPGAADDSNEGDDKPESDPRGERNGREKPNQVDQVAGGGIGATVGGSGSSSGRGGDTGGDSGSSVEFAKDAKDKDEDDDRERPNPTPGVGGSSQGGRGGVAGGDFGNRKDASGRKDGQDHDDEGAKDDDQDLDYRDEMDVERKRGGRPAGTPSPHGNDERHDKKLDDDDDHDDDDVSRRPSGASGGRHAGDNDSKGASKHHHEGDHCNDDAHHHHHHDTIEWLRGAIPGEPGDDYPVLSRVNSSNFKCSQQKHAGYYADVESRCQIFHICQADGRQDSFLCPNGTIFSQKTLVCVWWNGFQCEDAPKFYHLNELLYKSTSGSASPQSVALPSLRPRGGEAAAELPSSSDHADDDDDAGDSSIEGLVKRMRGRRPQAATAAADDDDESNSPAAGGAKTTPPTQMQTTSKTNGGPKTKTTTPLDADDLEPTIQRKQSSTNFNSSPDDYDDGSSPETAPARSPSSSSSRVRARDNIPRRKRRASTRQAPPKLKSRRVSRNSRRRKLRHGIKPRRRA